MEQKGDFFTRSTSLLWKNGPSPKLNTTKRAFLTKVTMNFVVWKHCFKILLMSSQEFAEKLFCATVQNNFTQTASVGTVIVLDLPEL